MSIYDVCLYLEEGVASGMIAQCDRPSSPSKVGQPPVIVNSPPAFHLDHENL